MPNAFAQKLGRRAVLDAEDIATLEAACAPARRYRAKQDLLCEGDEPGHAFVFLEGWGYRYTLLPEGGRQVLAFLMPGDFFNLHTSLVSKMDHSLATATPALVVAISRPKMKEMARMRPAISQAFRLTQYVDLALTRSWMTNIGRRSTTERFAHLICEIYHRANHYRPVDNGQCAMPISQILLADALGLTSVHVNRVLRKFREAGLMDLKHGNLVISDIAQLVSLSGFSDAYLHRRTAR